MKTAIFLAAVLHTGFILFGGLLVPNGEKDHTAMHVVELVSDAPVEEKKEKQKEPEPAEKVENADQEAPPSDAESVVRSLQASENKAPALELASLSSIEAALSGSGGGEFGEALAFVSGGRIDGKGRGSPPGESSDNVFSMAEIDQKPRPMFQTSPIYPSEMRGKKIEGVVTVMFIVDVNGKVIKQRVEKSTHVAFEKPALEAVKQWKFEPAIKSGQRVACKMRVPIHFQAS